VQRTGALLFVAALLGGYVVAARFLDARQRAPLEPAATGSGRQEPHRDQDEGRGAGAAAEPAAVERQPRQAPSQRLPQPQRAVDHEKDERRRDKERIERQAERLERRETLTRQQVRDLVVAQLAEQLPDRQLEDAQLERLTDAAMTLRAAQRVLRHLRPDGAGEEIRERYRQERIDALTEIFSVTGMSTSDLGKVTDAANDR